MVAPVGGGSLARTVLTALVGVTVSGRLTAFSRPAGATGGPLTPGAAPEVADALPPFATCAAGVEPAGCGLSSPGPAAAPGRRRHRSETGSVIGRTTAGLVQMCAGPPERRVASAQMVEVSELGRGAVFARRRGHRPLRTHSAGRHEAGEDNDHRSHALRRRAARLDRRRMMGDL